MEGGSAKHGVDSATTDQCGICRRAFNSSSDILSKSCGHRFHETCVSTLREVSNVTTCTVCLPSLVETSVRTGTLPVDRGNCSAVRAIVAGPIPAQALVNYGIMSLGDQPVVPPVDDSAAPPSGLLGSIVHFAQSKLSGAPPDSYTSDNEHERVHAMVVRRDSAKLMRQSGFSMRSLLGARITWREWEVSGYGVQDAIDMGSTWDDLVHMGFGRPVVGHDPRDYHLLRGDAIRAPFPRVFADVFDRSWKAIGEQMVPAPVLAALGFTVMGAIRLKIQDREWPWLRYISRTDFCTHLGLTNEVMASWAPSQQLLITMKWVRPPQRDQTSSAPRRAHFYPPGTR